MIWKRKSKKSSHSSAKALKRRKPYCVGSTSKEASESQLLLNKVTAWPGLGKQTFPLELPLAEGQADILEPLALKALLIKISLLSQKEHCAKLFQLRDSLGNVCKGQGKASVSCLHGNPKVLNLPIWQKHQQSLWTSETDLGWQALNSRTLGAATVSPPQPCPRSRDTGTRWQHCVSKPNTAFSSCYFISPAPQATANVTFPARSALAIF